MNKVEEILSRTDPLNQSGRLPIPLEGEEIDEFVFAMLYESEPSSIL